MPMPKVLCRDCQEQNSRYEMHKGPDVDYTNHTLWDATTLSFIVLLPHLVKDSDTGYKNDGCWETAAPAIVVPRSCQPFRDNVCMHSPGSVRVMPDA